MDLREEYNLRENPTNNLRKRKGQEAKAESDEKHESNDKENEQQVRDKQADARDTRDNGDQPKQQADKAITKRGGKRVKQVASKTKLNERNRKQFMNIKRELSAVVASYKPSNPKALTKAKVVKPQSKKQPPPKAKKIKVVEGKRKRPRLQEVSEDRRTGRLPKKHKPTSLELGESTSKIRATRSITTKEKRKEKGELIRKKREDRDIEDNELTMKAQARAGHLKLFHFVSQLTEEKKQVIRKIGFGALLTIDFPCSKRLFNKSLLDSFDPDSSCLLLPLGNVVEIKEEDVEIVFGLPRGEIEIEEPTFQQYSPHFRQFLTEWRKSWGLDPMKGSPTTANIINRYTNELRDHPPDEQFIRHFVICAVNCLMVSRASNECNFKFLNSIMDIKKIRSVNWCKFVHQQLIQTVKDYKKKKPKFYTGPLWFLTLCYFDRIERQGVQQPRKIPLVSTWTRSMIQKRLAIELEDGFGRGKQLERIVQKEGFPQQVNDKQNDVQRNASTSIVSDEDNIEVFFEKFFNLLKTIGPHMKELGSIIMKAEKLFPNTSLLKNTTDFIRNIMQEGRKERRSILSPDEEVYCSDSFLEEVARIEKSFLEEFKNKDKHPFCSKQDFNPFKMFDLGIDSSTPTQPNQGVVEKTPTQADELESSYTMNDEVQPPPIQELGSLKAIVSTMLELRTPNC